MAKVVTLLNPSENVGDLVFNRLNGKLYVRREHKRMSECMKNDKYYEGLLKRNYPDITE
ncbi:hypothetical protein [Parvicella tangerina]|uniref:Uncharacterized protein n=1 Tax=Parvicella tangerina TaxID=2829795 RepID=A0A916JKC8_9FLAO|nr:hypothetical protein [Parvicella tangerina]CAG5076701.1 hypothetical protein CRYO30217_00176 [Parvicella tangerina]